MKKTYAKPKIIFEDFTLNESIAGDCETKTHTPAQEKCGLEMGAFVVFIDGLCNFVPDGGMYNGICYHVPNGDNSLFNS